ncbi:MAG: AP2 domain-containing protein [Rhodocyclaceae bacterium]|nr:AP2 domain-containing protein [Rhodocyclaceae bacterium]
MDNATSRTHGWLVTIQRRGVIYRKHFSDGVLGGKAKSFAAAKAYRDEVVAQHPPLSMQEYSSIVKRNNRSGVVGVCRYCATETRDLPEEKQRWFWVASWPLPDGRRKRVKFSIKKFGDQGAFDLALQARSDALKKLHGDFDPGAVRRRRGRKRSPAPELAAKAA